MPTHSHPLSPNPDQGLQPSHNTFLNHTELDVEKTWKSSPRERGTMDLIFSCTVTILLAVWSSVLINIQMSPDAILEMPNPENEKNKDSPNHSSKEQSGLLQTIRNALSPRQRARWKYKVLWAFLNVMVPELGLAIALDEWRKAKDFLNELRTMKSPDGEMIFKHWDMSLAFYVVMGGFYVRKDDPGPEGPSLFYRESLVDRCATIPRLLRKHHQDIKNTNLDRDQKKQANKESKPRHVLTTHGVLFVARYLDRLENCPRGKTIPQNLSLDCALETAPGEICECARGLHAERLRKEFSDIPTEIVADLSKIDWVGRVIFMFQGSWMIIQTIGRRIAGLPISLLELHAALHAGIAVIQYTIWWFKPVDMVVMTPLTWPCEISKAWATCEVTNHHRLEKETEWLLKKIRKDHLGRPYSIGGDGSSRPESARSLIQHDQYPSSPLQGEGPSTDPEKNIDASKNPLHRWWSGLLKDADSTVLSQHYFTSRATLGKEGYKQVTGYVSVVRNPVKGITLAIVMLTLSWHRWPYKALLWFGSCLTYSAIHLGAWHWHFPTHTEQILWHWCTSLTTGSLGALSLLAFLATLYRMIRLTGVDHPKWSIFSRFALSDGLLFLYRNGVRLVGVSIAVGAVPWLLARLFIFVEAAISVRSLQARTYETLNWSGFIPHI